MINKKILAIIFFAFTAGASFSQSLNSITGRVTNASTGEPLVNCSVFINSTSRGTVTNASGNFELPGIPAGKYDLIVSSIGYETYVYPFSGNQLPLELNIRLKEKLTDLSAVVVEPFVKDGWKTWGQTFIDYLIGTTDNARECTIRNKEVIHFRYSERNNLLTAVADEPLMIENKALGYIVKFQLEQFSVDLGSQRNVYLGYPLFIDISTHSNAMQNTWKENREKAYFGSIMHFMRSLYDNEIERPAEFNQEGFEMRRRIKLPNAEKLRVKEIYSRREQQKDSSWPADSSGYYRRIMRQSDSSTVNQVLTAKDLVSSEGDSVRSLFFTGRLSITYRRKEKHGREVERSTIYLLTPAPVQIEENGYYDSPLEIFTMGYWGKSQKLCNLLPLDYWPDGE